MSYGFGPFSFYFLLILLFIKDRKMKELPNRSE